MSSGSWADSFLVMSSGDHSIVIPAGTSGANLVNIQANTTGQDYYALAVSGSARVTRGKYDSYGSPGAGAAVSSGIYFAEKDTFIEDNNPDYNYGVDTYNAIGYTAPGHLVRYLVQFDLSSVPSPITSAELFFYVVTSTSFTYTLYVYRILDANSDWVEGTKNGQAETGSPSWSAKKESVEPWAGSAGLSTADTDYDSNELGSRTRDWTATPGGNWRSVELDATEIEKIRNGTYTNGGFFLRTDENDSGRVMYIDSREYTPKPPHLVLSYGYDTKTINDYPVSIAGKALLDDPEILQEGIEGDNWNGVWYDKDKSVHIKNLIEH